MSFFGRGTAWRRNCSCNGNIIVSVYPQGGHLPDYDPHPAIVGICQIMIHILQLYLRWKMEDRSDLLLPITVLKMPSMLLMADVRNVQIVRPTVYQLIKEMTDKMGYVVKLIRVTKRVREAYFAQLYLAKVGNEIERISFDLQPSDAINIAVRCKVPIQVNNYLAYSDGIKVVEASKMAAQAPLSDGFLFTELDRGLQVHVRVLGEQTICCDEVFAEGEYWEYRPHPSI